jgi:hypothetical protein
LIVVNAKTEFRERGKLKKASRIELSVRRLAASALKGDVGRVLQKQVGAAADWHYPFYVILKR